MRRAPVSEGDAKFLVKKRERNSLETYLLETHTSKITVWQNTSENVSMILSP